MTRVCMTCVCVCVCVFFSSLYLCLCGVKSVFLGIHAFSDMLINSTLNYGGHLEIQDGGQTKLYPTLMI